MSKKNSRKITPILSLFEWLLIGVKMMFKRRKSKRKKEAKKEKICSFRFRIVLVSFSRLYNQWLDEVELSRSALTDMIAKPKPNPLRNMVYLPSEEPIKRRFLNTPDGLALCQSSTTGWSPLSEACGRCDNWVECGKITAKKYPELMRFRKEIYGRQKK